MLVQFKKLKSHHQVIFALIISVGLIALWRGIWGLMDIYFFPSNQPLSLFLSVFLGIVMLFLVNYSIKQIV